MRTTAIWGAALLSTILTAFGVAEIASVFTQYGRDGFSIGVGAGCLLASLYLYLLVIR